MENEALISRILEKLETIENDQRDFKAEMNDFKTEMIDFKTGMNDFKTDMYDFKTEMCDFKTDMYDFKTEMYNFKTDMYDFKTDMNNFKTEVCDFRQETRAGFKELNGKLDLLTKQTSNAVIENHSNELKSLSGRVQKLEKDVYELRQS